MKKLAVCSCVAVLLFSSASAFALPKIKRIKISKAATRVSQLSKASVRGGNLRYARAEVSPVTGQATKAASHVNAITQRMERAVTQAEQNSRSITAQTARRAEIPTRVQAADIYERARIRSEQEGDPNILIRQEVEVSFMRYKREQLSQNLQSRVEQLRAQQAEPALQEVSLYYDGLREAEINRHRTTERDIIDRRIHGDAKAQYEHEPEMNRHLDVLDRINEAEIAAREEVAKNPSLSAASFKEREAKIVKEKQYLEDDKLELDWQREMLEKRNEELTRRQQQFKQEESDIIARMNAAQDSRVNDVFEQGRAQRDYELLREKQSQLAAEFDQYHKDMEVFNQSVERYNAQAKQLSAQHEKLSTDRKTVFKNPLE